MRPFERLGPAQGEAVLVIGGCGGIGRAVVRALVDIGCPVIVMDLAASLAVTDLPKSMTTIEIDLRDEASIVAAFKVMDNLPINPNHLVFASGYTADLMPIAQMNADVLDDVMGGNLRGQVLAAREALGRISSGTFVFLSTAIGQVGAPGYGPYGMAKNGLNSLTRILAAEAAPHIRVNSVAPGPVETAFVRGGLGRGVTETDTTENRPTRFDKAAFEARTPMGRLGAPDDMVGPILFLMSEAAGYITGQVIHVNGGAFMRD